MRLTILTAAAILGCAATPAAAKDADVFILGALHGLHEQEASFGYAELERVIDAIKPDVLLLEVTPEELAGKLETKGRPEYPKVIWPMLVGRELTAYAMEAAQPLYGELTGDASKRWGDFKQRAPAEDTALTSHSNATSNVLLAHWKSVADTQDEATDAVARARTDLNAAMVAGTDAGQRRWDSVMVDAAKAAIAGNPGKRILVLGSYRNRYMFVEQLRGIEGARLVDMKAWLEANGFGRAASASR
jgi:hypothetical protein